MANPTGTNAVAGKIAKTGIYEAVSRGVLAGQNIARGDTIAFDTNGWAKQGATTDSIDNGFGVAMIASDNSAGGAASGDTLVTVAVGNSWVFVKAGGAIKPMNLVKIGSATTVIAHDKPANATTTITNTTTSNEIDAARDYFGLTFGRYMGHQLQPREMTDAANADVIIVRLGV